MQKILKPVIVCLIATGLLLALHLSFPSLITASVQPNAANPAPAPDEFMHRIWYLHYVAPAFAGRPLTTFIIERLHQNFSLNYTVSFIAINFFLLFVCGLLVYALAHHHNSNSEALLGIILFYTSFSILFAFFNNIDTYDEPIQYVFVFCTFLLLQRGQILAGMLTFFVALLARETTALLIPALVLCSDWGKLFKATHWKNYFKKCVYLLVPTLLSISVVRFILQKRRLLTALADYSATQRLPHWHYNFQNQQFSTESILSLFLALALPTFVVVYHLFKNRMSHDERRAINAFLLTCLINTPIVFVAARARETRLFALPLLFLWPILGKLLLSFVQDKIASYRALWNETSVTFPQLLYSLLFLLSIPFWYRLATRLYIPAADFGFNFGYQMYLFTLLTAGSAFLLLELLAAPKRTSLRE